MGAMALGAAVGLLLGPDAEPLGRIARLILRLLTAVATPLIFVAIIHALLSAKAEGHTARRMIVLLITNTLVAICIGLLVANILQPGHHASLAKPTEIPGEKPAEGWDLLEDKIPISIVGSLADNKVIASILIALAFGIALRIVRQRQIEEGRSAYRVVEDFLDTAFSVLMIVLHWIINIIPVAVFAVVAGLVGTKGLQPFLALGWFVVSVLVALALQMTYYLIRVRWQSWVRPGRFLSGGADALLTAFSTASSTATMPITFRCLRQKVGLREEPATMGALVGSNFNNDGTALYEAMATLFIAQTIGLSFTLPKQFLVALMSVVASVGAPGIPEAGLVTMLLVFVTVGLPVEYVPLLLTVDWFLDRCRTAINVMGDMTVASILDGRTPESEEKREEPVLEPVG
jgi:DAACS family dicarboxylate/amino acid:cation (Na+ or H+) symporter